MPRTVSIGCQDFGAIRREGYFYIDKTHFIQEWWGGGDSVTLITRPRRFGKTLTMSMVEHFFSTEYADRGNLFENLAIWRDNQADDAILLEFKVHDPEEEASLEDTAAAALKQIEEKQYASTLVEKGFPAAKIRKYGFAFEGKKVLIESSKIC